MLLKRLHTSLSLVVCLGCFRYTFPSMNQVGEDLIHVLDELK